MTKQVQTQQNALPAFAVQAWEDAQTRAACLSLQDDHGADVALALTALFLAAGGLRADVDTAERLRNLAAQWTPTVIRPLRAARRALKGRDETLYAQARALETATELQLLALLDSIADTAPHIADGAGPVGEKLIAYNLAALIGAAADSDAARYLAVRWRPEAGAR